MCGSADVAVWVRVGIGIELGDALTNKLQVNYSVTCCNIHIFAHLQFTFYLQPKYNHFCSFLDFSLSYYMTEPAEPVAICAVLFYHG